MHIELLQIDFSAIPLAAGFLGFLTPILSGILGSVAGKLVGGLFGGGGGAPAPAAQPRAAEAPQAPTAPSARDVMKRKKAGATQTTLTGPRGLAAPATGAAQTGKKLFGA